MYLTPKTHVIVNSGNPVDCNPLIPVVYRVKGGWISLTPQPSIVLPPQTLEPMVQPTWTYREIEHLAESGIYSENDLSRLRDHIMFPMEQPALINSFAKAATGHRIPHSGITISNLLDEDALSKIASSAGERIWGGFLTFGTASAGILGVWIVFKAIKLLIDTIIHGYTLHSIYGWSLHLLGAVCSSITHLLLYLGKRAESKRPPSPTMEADNPEVIIHQPTPQASQTALRACVSEPTRISNPYTTPYNSAGYPQVTQELMSMAHSLNTIEDRLSKCLEIPKDSQTSK